MLGVIQVTGDQLRRSCPSGQVDVGVQVFSNTGSIHVEGFQG